MSDRQPLQTEMPALRRRAEAMLGKLIEKVVPSLAPENVEATAGRPSAQASNSRVKPACNRAAASGRC